MESNIKAKLSEGKMQFEFRLPDKKEIDPEKDFDPLLNFIDDSRTKKQSFEIKLNVQLSNYKMTKKLLEIIEGLEGLYLSGLALKVIWLCKNQNSEKYANDILFGLRIPHEVVKI